jgi:hypothetical protein
MEALVTRLAASLTPHGLNLVGVTDAAAYDAAVPARWAIAPHAPGARSLLVIGNGGAGLWRAFRRRLDGDPWLAREDNPLDAFTRIVVTDAVAPFVSELGRPLPIVFPFESGPPALSFVHLAECAGLGRASLLGILVHPEFGPWIALRAALLLPFTCDAPRPAEGFDPCPTCVERPCIAACPAGAVGAEGWDVPRCGAHRLSAVGDGCDAGCHARIACVLGPAHRYPPDSLAFHQAYARGAFEAAAAGRGTCEAAAGPPNRPAEASNR